jgi:hypothetical protein
VRCFGAARFFFKVSQTSCLAVAFLSAVALAKEEA